MNKSIREGKVKIVNQITGLPTDNLLAHNLHERNDLLKGKSFLRCSIQHWQRFATVCDEKLGSDLLKFVAMLILEVQEEVGTTEGFVCQSDIGDFTILDLSTVIPIIRERLQQRFAPTALEQEPIYVSRIRNQADGDKIPTSLKLITSIITADDFFQNEKHEGKEASYRLTAVSRDEQEKDRKE